MGSFRFKKNEQEEQELFTFEENEGGIVAELWVGPIELEPALGVMHVSQVQAEGALGCSLEEMVAKYEQSE